MSWLGDKVTTMSQDAFDAATNYMNAQRPANDYSGNLFQDPYFFQDPYAPKSNNTNIPGSSANPGSNSTTVPTSNTNVSPEATASANNGTETGGQTTSQLSQQPVQTGSAILSSLSSGNSTVTPGSGAPATSSMQLGGASSDVARDSMGSKLIERLQGAKTTQMEELANRLAAHGITGGQAASQMSRGNRDYMFGISQGLGDFDINRLNQAASINRDFLQLELQRQLGLGQLQLGSAQLDSQIALRLAEMAQYADTQTRAELERLMQQYFGGVA